MPSRGTPTKDEDARPTPAATGGAAHHAPPGIAREKKTVAAMVHLYCADHRHDAPDGCVCGTCGELLAYSHARLDRCPYGDGKPSCKECPVHCYKPDRREEMRQVMREAGPSMLLRHPILAIVHLWKDRFRKAPPRGRPSADGRPRTP